MNSDNIHKKCREIMAEIGKNGEFEFWDGFKWPPKIKLEKRLKNILEDNVDEKYYLSETFISGSNIHKERHQKRGNGFAFEPKNINEICGCLSTQYGNRQTDTYIKEPIFNKLVGNQEPKIKENYRIRKLTPRECFRLQDFPDDFKFVVSNSQLYKQAGNSISVNVMEMIFKQIEASRCGNTNGGLF